ncbi:MAG: virulence factor [Proteobacteria bacterium]|nr:virulence factor [Pseudomonadota bacterium]MDA1064579.1 virulence factor [Pseudomonadota bacterium]
MVKQTLIYWRDIPSQVILQRGRLREKAMLSARFQEAIDRAAMRAGKGSSDAYLSEWCRKTSSIESDEELGALAAAEVARLEAGISDEQLRTLIRNQGLANASASET